MFQCENDLYESKCIKITTTTTTTTTECFLKARQKNSDALKNLFLKDIYLFLGNEKRSEDHLPLIANHYSGILEKIGEDPTREGLLDTPMRAAKALMFFTKGAIHKPCSHFLGDFGPPPPP